MYGKSFHDDIGQLNRPMHRMNGRLYTLDGGTEKKT